MRSRGLVFLAFLSAFGLPVLAETSTTSLREQTRKQLRLESTATDEVAKEDAAIALCDLYVVLRSDPRFESSNMLKGDATKIRRRLLSIARRREIQLGRNGIERPKDLSRRVEDAIREWESNASESDSDQSDVVDDLSTSGSSAGGAIAAQGWELVALIEQIVAPDFWESRGGSGSIHYFAARRVLVVRATTDVHQQVKDLLTALR